jgi:photosystem II stability/assembly factor-like uncharacterized protein
MGVLGVNTLMMKSDGKIFAGLSNGTIYYSNTNGDSWSPVNIGLPGNAITDLKQKGTDSIVAGTMGGGIYLSVNDGSSWTAINQGLKNTQVQSIAFKSDGRMFAGTTGGLYYSTDNGSQWDTLPGSGAGDVRKIAIDPSDNIFAINFPSFSGVDDDEDRIPGLFKLANNSDTWLEIFITNDYKYRSKRQSFC